MNARSKKVLMTAGAALIAVLLPTGCALEALPGLVGGGTVTTGTATGGAAGGGAGGVIPPAMVP